MVIAIELPAAKLPENRNDWLKSTVYFCSLFSEIRLNLSGLFLPITEYRPICIASGGDMYLFYCR